MAYILPFIQAQIACDTGLSSCQVESWVTDSKAFEDGTGYVLYFRIDTPADVLALVPQINSAFQLVIAYDDLVVRMRRSGRSG